MLHCVYLAKLATHCVVKMCGKFSEFLEAWNENFAAMLEASDILIKGILEQYIWGNFAETTPL